MTRFGAQDPCTLPGYAFDGVGRLVRGLAGAERPRCLRRGLVLHAEAKSLYKVILTTPKPLPYVKKLLTRFAKQKPGHRRRIVVTPRPDPAAVGERKVSWVSSAMLLEAAIVLFAVARITWLITTDEITRPARQAAVRTLPAGNPTAYWLLYRWSMSIWVALPTAVL